MNKQTRLLQLLKKSPRGVSVLDAWKIIGACQVYDLVLKLRNKGYLVNTRMTRGVDRYGKPVRFAKYYLEG